MNGDKDRKISFRCTETEAMKISENAQKKKMTNSEYIRTMLFNTFTKKGKV